MFAVVYIPDFALQSILRNEPELASRPVAVMNCAEKKALVLQVTEAGRTAGVCEGLTSTQAMARCGEIQLRNRSQSNEAATTQMLLQVLYAFSPRLEITREGICTLDLQGLPVSSKASIESSSQQEKTWREWSEKILTVLKQLHLQAQIGLAATPNLALHAAREAHPILFIQNPREFISALPIERLDPHHAILDILQRWGIRTVGEFTALGKDRVAERLGVEALELFDTASFTEHRPLTLTIPAEEFSESTEFENEIEALEPLLFILRRYVEQLAHRINMLGKVVAELRLELKLSSGEKYHTALRVPAPSSNVEVLFRMLQTHLETVRTESPIVALELAARPTRAENFQFGFFEASLRDPNQFAETLARLSALCGDGHVGSARKENTHRADAFKMDAPEFEKANHASLNPLYDETCVQGLTLRRFRPPFHADVDVHGGRPNFIASLKLNAPVRKVSGPFRSSGDWWEQEKVWERDEWDIQLSDGALYRIYHSTGGWFIEGVYD